MENIYTVYTKKVNNELHYFVKHFTKFSEIAGAPEILSEYGMHKDFYKACALAKISDNLVIKNLSTQVYLPGSPAKVISFGNTKHPAHSFLRGTQNFLSKLRLAGLSYFF